MTVKKRVALAAAALVLAAGIFFLVWYLQKPKEAPRGVLVYKDAYMRMIDYPWQGERLCRNK